MPNSTVKQVPDYLSQQADNSWLKRMAVSSVSYLKSLNRTTIFSFLSSLLIAGTVAFGEALVAVFFMGATTSLMSMLAIAVPAFSVNFLLFRSDTQSFLQGWVGNELFKDDEKNSFIGWKKWFLRAAMFLAVVAGALCGILQFNSILTTLGGVFLGLSSAAVLAAPPLALFIGAALVAVASGLANAALLYANIEKFIRDEEYQQYIDTVKILLGKKTDPVTGKAMSLPWKIYHGLFFTAALTGAVAIYFVSLGIFKSQAFSFFHKTCHLPIKASAIAGSTVAHIGHLTNGFFYSRNILNFSRLVERLVKSVATFKFCLSVTSDFHDEKVKDIEAKTTSRMQLLADIVVLPVSAAVFGLLLYCCYINGVSQGQGAMNEPKSLYYLRDLLTMPDSWAKKTAFWLMTTASTYANAVACYDEIGPSMQCVSRLTQEGCNMVKRVVGYSRTEPSQSSAPQPQAGLSSAKLTTDGEANDSKLTEDTDHAYSYSPNNQSLGQGKKLSF